MQSIGVKIIQKLGDQIYVKDLVARGRQKTGGKNACAATMSLLLKDLELVDSAVTWTSQLVGSDKKVSPLEQHHPMLRLLHPADVRPGDLIASRDRNDDDNEAPDHVFTIVSRPEGPDRDNPFALVIDNYCRNGKPYWRNLGKSGWYKGVWRGKTPMAYALRFVDKPVIDADEDQELILARQQIVNALPDIYAAATRACLSLETMHYLNGLRWSAELGDLKPED